MSLYLLHGNTIHDSYSVVRSKVLYCDATVKLKYFSKEHLPYAVAAIVILIIFILSPALLLLCYPTKLFRKCSSYCRLRRWQALHVFAETFQGCYKDGVNGTKDFRSLAIPVTKPIDLPFLFRRYTLCAMSIVRILKVF